jgi:oligoendopeptidase F
MRHLILALLAGAWLIPATAAEEAAEAADPKYTWDLTEIYPTVEAWERARDEAMEDFAKVEERRGTLGESADSLYTTLRMISDANKKAARVYVYAQMQSHEDLQVTETQERAQLGNITLARLTESTAWLQPEILSVGREIIEAYINEDERLAPFAFQLDDSLRNEPHTLTEEAEEALSYFTQSFSAPQEIYDLVANSDIPWPTVTLSNGEEHVIDSQGYGHLRRRENREDRQLVFDTFWTKWSEYRNTVGKVLNTHLQTQVSLAKARNYDSVLERELFQDNLPMDIYRTLVAEVNNALPTLHRYFKLRGKMLGVDQMHYYDIYPPLVSLDKEFDFDTSKKITLEAMEILGEDWVSMQREGMAQRWVHALPKRGKRSGAYMQPHAHDVHPYILLNHTDDYASLSTMAHEWGHAMHSLYATQAQPYETVDYSTFIAEIPSTSLELILLDYMLENAETLEERIFYLGSALEDMRGTLFRQTMFAEFELALYEAAERGEGLSGERISEIYGELVRRYHGHDEGVVIIDDLYTNEWMFVPHFYLNMYVYQYATSQTAGTALYAMIKEQGEPAVENYKNLLRAGGSDYPYQLLLNAGVDMAKPEPYRAAVKKMNAIMDELEALLEQRDN